MSIETKFLEELCIQIFVVRAHWRPVALLLKFSEEKEYH